MTELKTLNDITNEFNQKYTELEPRTQTARTQTKGIGSSLLFYAFLIGIVAAAYFLTKGSGGAKVILGYSAHNVLTQSMQSEIPQGSLVITKLVSQSELAVGDDITFWKTETKTVTHRIVDIIENYDGYGSLGYQTMGVDNSAPDVDIVDYSNVVGKVVFHVPVVGDIIRIATDNIVIVAVFVIILVALIAVLKMLRKNKYIPETTG